jgi:hypothetical protein
MSSITSEIKIGQIGFGSIAGSPPAKWKLEGKRNGVWVLVHVKPASMSVAYRDQFVTWEEVERIMAG